MVSFDLVNRLNFFCVLQQYLTEPRPNPEHDHERTSSYSTYPAACCVRASSDGTKTVLQDQDRDRLEEISARSGCKTGPDDNNDGDCVAR